MASSPAHSHTGTPRLEDRDLNLPQPAYTRWRKTAQILVVAGWAVACVVGSYIAMRYDFQPGELGPAPAHWPADTMVRPLPGHTTALFFLHPRCVCTAASVQNVVKAMRGHPNARLISLVFVPPETAASEEWQNTKYEQVLRAGVPESLIVPDPGGRDAERFGAATSGTVLVYDQQGIEIFRGGITDRRGGEEDNPGFRQFVEALTTGHASEAKTPWPVFGCSLQTPSD